MRPRPQPPRPELVRRPTGAFGWLDARLLHEDWLGRLGPEAVAVLTLFALAADRHGASFYGRERIGQALALSRSRVDQALTRLLQLELVALRPWRAGLPDGVWQLLPLPASRVARGGGPVSIAAILAQLGLES